MHCRAPPSDRPSFTKKVEVADLLKNFFYTTCAHQHLLHSRFRLLCWQQIPLISSKRFRACFALEPPHSGSSPCTGSESPRTIRNKHRQAGSLLMPLVQELACRLGLWKQWLRLNLKRQTQPFGDEIAETSWHSSHPGYILRLGHLCEQVLTYRPYNHVRAPRSPRQCCYSGYATQDTNNRRFRCLCSCQEVSYTRASVERVWPN